MQIRIATRRSPLAMWQAEHVQERLRSSRPDVDVTLIPMVTEGDRKLGQSLAAAGGKGLFLKELEHAMSQGRADIAVHSMKDVPTELPPGFAVGAILRRAPVADAVVSNTCGSLSALPVGARVGTSSLRRRAQVLALRPDLQVLDLRGNVNTRLGRLDAGEYDAILLAAAGLERLGLEQRIRERLDPPDWLPAAGQGAVGIECLEASEYLLEVISTLNHPATAQCVEAERSVAQALGASCHLPVAAYAELSQEGLSLEGLVGDPDGERLLRARVTAADRIEDAGAEVAARLLEQGARDILDSVAGNDD